MASMIQKTAATLVFSFQQQRGRLALVRGQAKNREKKKELVMRNQKVADSQRIRRVVSRQQHWTSLYWECPWAGGAPRMNTNIMMNGETRASHSVELISAEPMMSVFCATTLLASSVCVWLGRGSRGNEAWKVDNVWTFIHVSGSKSEVNVILILQFNNGDTAS